MAIQQHPIPQDISNYRFRLIGDMTIRQFASLGISIILSVIIYSSPLPFFFKYPLSFFFLVLGVGMAFVPIQGRTLDIWIVAFIKSIYSPTQYIWKHGQEGTTPNISSTNTSTIHDLQSTNSTPNTPVIEITPPVSDSSLNQAVATPSTTDTSTGLISQTPTPQTEQSEPTFTPNAAQQGEVGPTPAPEPIIPTTQISPSTSQKEATIDTEIEVKPNSSEPAPKPESPSTIYNPQSTISSPTTLPIPFTPSTPNTLVGLTLTPDGHILDGVMIEIKNQGLTLRATKSNKLGQFLFARPLENGLYQIFAEKEDYKFSEYSIELNGNIMNPLKIQATN